MTWCGLIFSLRLPFLTCVYPRSSCRGQRRDSSPHRPLLYRILRAAFPLHLVCLVLLVLVCLVPVAEEDYSCTLSNNFARSFYLMLRYTNGPPPTWEPSPWRRQRTENNEAITAVCHWRADLKSDVCTFTNWHRTKVSRVRQLSSTTSSRKSSYRKWVTSVDFCCFYN